MRSLFSILFIACVVAFIGQLVTSAAGRQSSLLNEWSLYKRQYGKVYETPMEDSRRFSLFMAAKNKIEHHNSNANASYKLGLNHMSDWTEKELSRLRGVNSLDAMKHMKQSPEADAFMQKLMNDPTPVPDEVDWRKVENRVSPVKDQGFCGSCWAFATVGVLEGQQVVRNYTKKLISLSAQNVIDCSELNSGCGGGFPKWALEDIAELGGIESDSDYPYEAQDHFDRCKFNENLSVMTTNGYYKFYEMGEEILKKLLATFGPVSVLVDSSTWQDYESGVHECEPGDIDHAVLAVGYGTDPRLGDYWIIKNSWSDGWGEKGYIRLRRGLSACSIGEFSTIPKWNN
uniref:Cathepsin L n=1 Tax=Aceria tosichella TaxID=561515 RepID=A0A6G1SAY7_9ACAR